MGQLGQKGRSMTPQKLKEFSIVFQQAGTGASAEGRRAGPASNAVSSPVPKCLHKTFPPAGVTEQETTAVSSTGGSFTLQELAIGNLAIGHADT